MKDLSHLSGKKVDSICCELWKNSGSLKGMSAVLKQQMNHPCYEGGELFGIGQLLESLSEQISRQEDILQCGYDSRAVSKRDNDDHEDDDPDKDGAGH